MARRTQPGQGRAFGDFAVEVFQRLEAARGAGAPAPLKGQTPGWFIADHVGGLAGRWKPRTQVPRRS